jgi:response regulator RpfG family c-di-GMP phosphodiesterase
MALVLVLMSEGGVTLVRERKRGDRAQRRTHEAQRLIVQALTSLTETRDRNTGRHARRTQEYTRLLATALARKQPYRRLLSPERLDLIATLAPLHDIGKVGVSDAVLRKPGALTDEELAEMRRHPGLGHDSLLKAEALAGVHDDEVIGLAKEIVHTHHEHWDGSGYPQGLSGSAIPLSGRIVALVDVYDAMVADRAYRQALSHEHAVEAIRAARGHHFDPDIVDAFLSVEEEFKRLSQQQLAS